MRLPYRRNADAASLACTHFAPKAYFHRSVQFLKGAKVMVSFLSRRVISVLAIAMAVSAASARAAAPLVDRVPGDAVAYIGWAGADSLTAAYQASDLSAFIDHSNLPQVAREYLPKLWDKIAGDSEDDKKSVAILQNTLPLLWRHPVAIYASHVTIGGDGTPDANVALICDAGTDAAELKSDLEILVKGNSNLHVAMDGSVVTVGVDKSGDVAAATTLAADPKFIATMQKLQSSPAIVVYVDGKTMLAKANESAKKDTHGAADIWPKVRDALGFANIQTYAMTAGFDGANWMTASLLEAPGPRTGLLAAIEPKPIDPALLARIPASAGSVSVYNLDLAGLFDTIANVMAVSNKSDTTFHQVTGIATMALGRNLRRQILAPLGTQWVVYSDSQQHSMVLLNHPTDADSANDSLVSVLFGLTNLANSQIPGATTTPVVNANQATVKGIDVTSAVMKFASPSFAAKLGVLYFGLTPESVVISATAPASTASNDLMHAPGFVAAVARLGVPSFASFDYCDLPNTAPKAYDNFGAIGAQIRQLAAMAGVEIPKVELPPIDELKMHLSPALSVSWADDRGVYSKSISPFPLSTHLLGDPQQSLVSAGTLSLGAAVLMPAFARARHAAMEAQNASQERQVMLGVIMYAQSHQGDMPADLGSLISDGVLPQTSLKIFLLPGSKITIPPEILNGSKDQQAAWVNDNVEYKYLTAGKKLTQIGNASEVAVLVPKDAEHAGDRVPIGFADGHCESCKPDRVQHFLHPDAAGDQ
jgi:hypothetical protein